MNVIKDLDDELASVPLRVSTELIVRVGLTFCFTNISNKFYTP